MVMISFGKERRKRRRFSEEALVHMDGLYGLALRLSKHERDAEDLVQDTYLKAYQHFDKYRPGTNCKAWLFKILTNTFINRYRKHQRSQTYLAEDLSPSPLERLAAKEPNPIIENGHDQAKLLETVFGDEVNAALAKVPVDFRMAVLLVDLFDCSYKECADIMDCPIGTVMSRLHRGRQALQRLLVDYAIGQGIIKADHTDDLQQRSGGAQIVPLRPKRMSGGSVDA